MLQAISGYGMALFCALIVILGDTVLKAAAEKGETLLSQPMLLGCLLYAVSAVAWFLSMRHISLTQGAIAYTMFSLIALAVIGALVFGERLQTRELAGIACALAAVVLMIRVA